MAAVRDSFLDLEKHRLQLEDSIAKLQKALQHWQKWDAEYESLKEEIESVPQPASREALARIRRDFEGEVVDKKEINDLFGRIDLKPADQIVNLLSRRIDYVSKNIATLEKQLESAEQKHAAASVVSNPDVRDEDGLPITEIIEELDEEGNVLSSRLQQPGDSSAQIKEILEKAGVKDIPAGQPSQTEKTEAIVEDVTDEPLAETPESILPAHDPAQSAEESIPEAEVDDAVAVKKSVSFAEDTKPSAEEQVSRNAQRVEEIMQTARSQEDISREAPVIPEDESEEDAFLRREMLKYGMEEVGQVVAELNLEDGSGEDDEDWEYEYSDLEDEEEDKFGRSISSVLDDGYHQRMLELEKRLGVKSRFTEKPEADDQESDEDQQGIGRIIVNSGDKGKAVEAAKQSPVPTTSILRTSSPTDADESKKSVRFAQSLDVAPDSVPETTAAPPIVPQLPSEPIVEPLSDIVERTGPAKQAEAKSTRKASRFKKQKAAPTVVDDGFVPMGPRDVPSRFIDQDRPTAPTGPEGKTLADAVVEKDSKPQDENAFDEDFIDQDLADEYHRQRRNFIQKQGGFLQEDTSVVRPLDEADGGQRISKFKAARLSKQ
ncbi:Prefoldin subunit-domain-containing protein [Colletotrichum godetiae]|uniref:Prefoldin subunit-domain-containing protein n=1 Tax=Colletotrichum godetiae TaxID=1209918 RepID=A0AAJ0AE91_9PEZI|nr:Prefoldin subunit-domain-containing protein [Colletotrichum godetiae]KAK1672303.1 Prefoldin subunit-domain-containing protein [Colletotrichum godetiae]